MNVFSIRTDFRRRLMVIVLTLAVCGLVGSCRTDVADQSNATADADPAIRVSSAGKETSEPAVATFPDGTVLVVYVSHEPDKSSDLFLSKFNGDLKPSGESVRINANAGEVKSWYGDPPTVATAADGTVYVGWTRRQSGSAGTDLVLSVSHDGGRSFEAPVKVNDDTVPAAHGMHSLAVDGDRVYMSWLDERNVRAEHAEIDESTVSPVEGFQFIKAHHQQKAAADDEGAEPNSEVYFASSTDGGKSFSKNIRVASDVCPCCKTSTLAAAGKLYLSWRQVLPGSFRHIAVASSGDGGQSFSKGVIVSDDKWMLSACPVSGAALATNAAGELSVYWYTAGAAGEPGIYYARSVDGGRTFGERRLVDANAASGIPAVVVNGANASNIVAANSDGRAVVLDGDGAVVRTYADATVPTAASDGKRAVIAFVRNEGNGRSVWLTR